MYLVQITRSASQTFQVVSFLRKEATDSNEIPYLAQTINENSFTQEYKTGYYVAQVEGETATFMGVLNTETGLFEPFPSPKTAVDEFMLTTVPFSPILLKSNSEKSTGNGVAKKQVIRRAGGGTPVSTTALETELTQLKADLLQTTDGVVIAQITAKIGSLVAQIKAINPLSTVTTA